MHPTDVHPYIHAYTLAHTHAHLDVLTGIQDMIKLGQLHPNPSLPLNTNTSEQKLFVWSELETECVLLCDHFGCGPGLAQDSAGSELIA